MADKRRWRLHELRALPQYTQVTAPRPLHVEGWSAIGKWGGPRFGDFLRRRRADLGARYVGFRYCRRLLHQHRHGDRPAPADAALRTPIGTAAAAQAVRLSDEAAHGSTKLGYKNPGTYGHLVSKYLQPRLLGGPGLQLVRRQLNERIHLISAAPFSPNQGASS